MRLAVTLLCYSVSYNVRVSLEDRSGAAAYNVLSHWVMLRGTLWGRTHVGRTFCFQRMEAFIYLSREELTNEV